MRRSVAERLVPLIDGGGHENGLRSGTLNVPGIVGFGKTCEIAQQELPVVIGGDHSCAIGTWKGVAAGLREQGPIGLIWVDAHMDAHTSQTTPSGALHGMPLACLLGAGEQCQPAQHARNHQVGESESHSGRSCWLSSGP